MRAASLGLILGTCLVVLAQPAGAEFWCSPGFEPRGGGCVAVLSRDEILIYGRDEYVVPRHYRRHRRGLREMY